MPLHTSPQGLVCGRAMGTLLVTADSAERLVRLPLWVGLYEEDQQAVINAVCQCLGID